MKSLQEMESDESRGKAQPPEPNTGENQNAEVPEVSDDDVEQLHDQLDELNSALDALEQKNENIQERLKELLQSSRDLRNGLHDNEVIQ